MPITVFVETRPIVVLIATSAAEALAIAKEQAIMGIPTSFQDASGPLTFDELLKLAVTPSALNS